MCWFKLVLVPGKHGSWKSCQFSQVTVNDQICQKWRQRKNKKKTTVSKKFGIKFDNSEAAISSGVQTLNISTVVKPQIKSKPQNICYK